MQIPTARTQVYGKQARLARFVYSFICLYVYAFLCSKYVCHTHIVSIRM